MSAAALSFAVMSALAKILGRTLPSGEVAFFRAALTGLFILPFALRLKTPLFGLRRGPLFLRGLFGSASLILGFYAVNHLTLANAILLWQTSVFFVPLLAALVFGERMRPLVLAYSAAAFVGCALILKPSPDVINLGGLAALAAGLGVAIVSLTVRVLHATENSVTIIWCFGFYTSLICAVFFGGDFRMPAGNEWFAAAGIGIFGTIGQLLFTESFRYAPAPVVQPYLFLQVVAGAILGFAVFGEIPDAWSMLGAILVIGCGVKILSLAANDPSSAAAAPPAALGRSDP